MLPLGVIFVLLYKSPYCGFADGNSSLFLLIGKGLLFSPSSLCVEKQNTLRCQGEAHVELGCPFGQHGLDGKSTPCLLGVRDIQQSQCLTDVRGSHSILTWAKGSDLALVTFQKESCSWHVLSQILILHGAAIVSGPPSPASL